MRGITFIESHTTDGSIFVNVEINGSNVGTITLALDEWDTLRAYQGLTELIWVMNLSEAREVDPDRYGTAV